MRAYRDWLAKFRLADNEKNRREWEKRNPVVTGASGHHNEGVPQTGLSSLSVVAPNRKPTASEKTRTLYHIPAGYVYNAMRRR